VGKRPAKRVKTIELEETPYLELATPSLERTLDEIQGQPSAIATLEAAIRSGRVHHAWIFHGPEGVGKFTTALAFAAVLLDPSTEADLSGRVRPDPESPVQQLLREGRHPDLHVIRKELSVFSQDAGVRGSKQTTIAKEVIESRLLEPAYLASTMAGGLASKVFIVDEAELLDRSATQAVSQNALLKTMEEPPDGTVIILVTSAESQLLPTIRSRSQRVPFGPLPEAAMSRWIAESGLDLGAGADWLMRYAGGSPGRLREAVETGLGAWRGVVDEGLDRAFRGEYDPMLAPALRDLVEGWAKAWVGEDEKRSKEAANRMAMDRLFSIIAAEARRRLADPASRIRALGMIVSIGRAERRLDANTQVLLVLEGLAADLPSAVGIVG
jgi:DNA polymerase-3 subunit delta'